jgi:hypothetical protein
MPGLFLSFFFLFGGDSVLAKKVLYHLSTPLVHFALIVLEMGEESSQTVLQAGLERQTS